MKNLPSLFVMTAPAEMRMGGIIVLLITVLCLLIPRLPLLLRCSQFLLVDNREPFWVILGSMEL